MNTQDEEKELNEAYEYFREYYLSVLRKTDPEVQISLNPVLEATSKKALATTYRVFWKRQSEPVNEPQVGEWWLLTTSGGCVAEKEQLLLRLPNGDWLTHSKYFRSYYIQSSKKLICKVPPRFPRLAKLLARIKSFLFQKKHHVSS